MLKFTAGGNALNYTDVRYIGTYLIFSAKAEDVSEIGKRIENYGLTFIREQKGMENEAIQLPAKSLTVEVRTSRCIADVTVHFKDAYLSQAMHAVLNDGHFFTSSKEHARFYAELASTFAYHRAKPVVSRNEIVVYCNSNPKRLALNLIDRIGVKIVLGESATLNDIHKHEPSKLLSALSSYFSNSDMQVRFLPHDEKKRPLFISVIGAKRVEFSEPELNYVELA